MSNSPAQTKAASSEIQAGDPSPSTHAVDLTRRGFLRAGGAGALAAGGLAAGGLLAPGTAGAAVIGPLDRQDRRERAMRVRQRAARNLFEDRLPEQPCNGDETAYADRRACFTKTMPQDNLGEVDTGTYRRYLNALERGDQGALESVPASPQAERGLANPLAAYAYEMTGGDAHSSRIPPAPAFSSPTAAAEMGEVYWQALTRDVPFNEYGSHPLIGAALDDLNRFSATVGPRQNGRVTARTLFRGETPGDRVGPYLSQFLWLDIPFAQRFLDQRYEQPLAGDDFMVDYSEWLTVQRGAQPIRSITFDPTPRYIASNRGLGEWVHVDFSFQAYLNAALIMLGFGPDALSETNPYLQISRQESFATFGGPFVLDLVTKAASVGLKTAWFQKWLVHRRLRPEAFGGRVENQQSGAKDYGVHGDLMRSNAIERVLSANGTALLPVAFPEGSPTHPSYPAGHACMAGACATVLKACFNESYAIQAPVIATSDGLALDDWTGDDLTLGGEINKLANNISIGRDAAGVHYRSDGIQGMNAGEQVAIDLLRDYSYTTAEVTDGFELTRFNGQRILINDGEVFEA